MRFSYEPENSEVSIYIKKEEFDLAANEKEYKVFTRQFTPENLQDFIESYTDFIKNILINLMPSENIQDIITVSDYKSGYTWRSLLNMDFSDESTSFLENMVAYGLHIIDQEGRSKNSDKTIADYISQKDASKLSLIMTLLDLPSLPEPFKKRNKRKPSKKVLQNRLDAIDKKLKTFEQKFDFDSDTMFKFYEDDKMPEKDISAWLNLYNEKKFIISVKNREELAEKLLVLWSNKSEVS
jgi:hypothetical protein